MAKIFFAAATAAFMLTASLTAQTSGPYSHSGNPEVQTGGGPNTIVTGRYGYWRFQPVKIAYFCFLPQKTGEFPPTAFQVRNMMSKTVFSGKLQLMRTPWNVLAPVGYIYPGELVYGLDFSKLNVRGSYYITIKGYPDSEVFNISGDLPVSVGTLPSLITFEEESGMLPDHLKPIVTDSFLNNPMWYPIYSKGQNPDVPYRPFSFKPVSAN